MDSTWGKEILQVVQVKNGEGRVGRGKKYHNNLSDKVIDWQQNRACPTNTLLLARFGTGKDGLWIYGPGV